MNDTVQENVLMGEDLDPERYRRALRVAQLGPDLLILPQVCGLLQAASRQLLGSFQAASRQLPGSF
jgi:hypothetical protein